MNQRVVLTTLFYAGSIGAIVAVMNGEAEAISLRIWLAAFAIWFALASLVRLTAEVPLFPSRRRGLSFPSRPNPSTGAGRLRELRAVESLVLRSRDNDRAFTQQLRPRLIALADHNLPVHHGIDRLASPERAQALLGDVNWLLDPTQADRTPTIDELDTLIDLLVTPPRASAEEAP